MPQTSGDLRRIGVLGGMGVEATLALLQRVHGATAAEDDQDHIPMFVDMNPQVPSRIRYVIEKDGPDPGPILAAMAVGLERAGAQVLAMPCNTAHLFAADIERRVSIPLLNMPRLACRDVAHGVEPGGTVGILASPATNSTGLFSDMLAEDGIGSIFPENEAGMLASIRRIKSAGPSQQDVDLLDREARILCDRGAASVIVGCSEFSLISAQLAPPVPVLDTLDVLARAIIAFSGARTRLRA